MNIFFYYILSNRYYLIHTILQKYPYCRYFKEMDLNSVANATSRKNTTNEYVTLQSDPSYINAQTVAMQTAYQNHVMRLLCAWCCVENTDPLAGQTSFSMPNQYLSPEWITAQTAILTGKGYVVTNTNGVFTVSVP